MLKLKINVKLHEAQLLCIVISAFKILTSSNLVGFALTVTTPNCTNSPFQVAVMIILMFILSFNILNVSL